MMTPEVPRFVRDVMLRGRRAVDPSDSFEAERDRWAMWRQTEDRMRAAGQCARTVADLPQWLLDLADQLGIERPVARHEDSEPLPVIEADREPWNANWARRQPESGETA